VKQKNLEFQTFPHEFSGKICHTNTVKPTTARDYLTSTRVHRSKAALPMNRTTSTFALLISLLFGFHNASLGQEPENYALLIAVKSYEHRSWGHGAFTKCLLESMEKDSLISNIAMEVGGLANKPGKVQQLVDQIRSESDRSQVPAFLTNVTGIDLGLKIKRKKTTIDESMNETDIRNDISGSTAGQLRAANSAGITMAWIPAGTFMMGSPTTEEGRSENENQVSVTLTSGFWMGQTEVTQGQWKSVMGTEPWKGKDYVKEGPNYAASYVSWDDATEF